MNNSKTAPEFKLLASIFGGEDPEKCDALLSVRNKVFAIAEGCGNAFTDEELESLTDVICEYCLTEGYITWDENKNCYVRNSDGKPICEINVDNK